MSEGPAGLLRFLVELRRRLVYCVLTVVSLFLVLLSFSNDLYDFLALPLLRHLPAGQNLIATTIVAPFFVPFKLTGVIAFFLAIPVFLYQVWAFMAPALYQHEKHKVWPLLLVSTGLFYCGVAFAYFVIFPLVFAFFAQAVPAGVKMMPDMTAYLDFALQLFFVFGVIFEVPVATVLLVWSGWVHRETLRRIRPYVIVGAFIVGMLFGPPDVLSQTLLAIPLWLLFEVGIVFSRFFEPAPECVEII